MNSFAFTDLSPLLLHVRYLLRKQASDGLTKSIPPTQPFNFRILKSLNHPTVIIGFLTIPAYDKLSTSNLTLRCPKTDYFLVSDDSLICCDVLEQNRFCHVKASPTFRSHRGSPNHSLTEASLGMRNQLKIWRSNCQYLH